MPHTLYICYFGVREPLVRTQVLPYLRELVKDGIRVSLLTFEPDMAAKWTVESIAAERAALASDGITWHQLAYHKRPSAIATAYDIFNGTRFIRRLMKKEKIDVLHGRVHVATLMGALARRWSGRKPKLIFDIRGFFPEEYTDAGIWPENGSIYRAVKRVERWLMRQADGFVILTETGRKILFPDATGSPEKGFSDTTGRPVEVIPCCVDLDRFSGIDAATRLEMRERLRIGDRQVIAYVGSFGGWYLTDEMYDLFSAARIRDPKVFVMILTQTPSEQVIGELKKRGFADGDMFVGGAAPGDVPKYLSAADIAVSFIKPCFSKLASSPTKNAEYLAAGLPIIANSGIGDVDDHLSRTGVGVMLNDLTNSELMSAMDAAANIENAGERCRSAAIELYDLREVGGIRYRRLYQRLSES